MTLNGKVALVTGAAQGIGRCIALSLAKDGADIAIVDIKPDKMAEVADKIEALARKATTFKADVSNRAEVYAAVEDTEKKIGGFDIMVNNAGIAQVDPIADVKPEDVDLILKINIQGVLWGIQAAAAKFKSLDHGGEIINASPIAGHDGFAMLGIYSATKFAVRALTQAAAKEYASDGITVNAYCPGIVGTDMWVEIDKRFSELTGAPIGETYDKYVGGRALDRAQTPDDVAAFVSYAEKGACACKGFGGPLGRRRVAGLQRNHLLRIASGGASHPDGRGGSGRKSVSRPYGPADAWPTCLG